MTRARIRRPVKHLALLGVKQLALLAVMALSGCIPLGARYERPTLELPGAYSQGPPGPATITDAWWKEFGDPRLDALVEEALAANQDLAAAAAAVEEARALAGIARSFRYPEVWAEGSARRSKISEETSQLPPSVPATTTRIGATANLSFELDFWGRLAKASAAARAELLASEEGRRNVRLGVAADAASAWFDLLALDRALAIARDTTSSRSEDVRLEEKRFDAGTISELDVAQARADLAATEAAVPVLEREARETEDRLMVLLGRIGGTIERNEGGLALSAVKLPDVPPGLPSTLLQRRPDVAAAEHRLAAAHARIAAARAAYFPFLTLTGEAGSESSELRSLFTGGTSVWSAALGLIQPIFQRNRTRRQVEAVRARERQALAVYRKTVQTAFADVEDALAGRSTHATERAALERAVASLARARFLANLRYEAGETSYLEVLDAQRSLFRAELALTEARREEYGAAVTLFKALGGGFEADAATAPVPAATAAPEPAVPAGN